MVSEGGTAGVPHDARSAETHVQYNVLMCLSDGDNDVVMKLIDLFGGFFRKVIKEFRKDGRIPSEQELIKYTTKYYGRDITKVAKELKTSK